MRVFLNILSAKWELGLCCGLSEFLGVRRLEEWFSSIWKHNKAINFAADKSDPCSSWEFFRSQPFVLSQKLSKIEFTMGWLLPMVNSSTISDNSHWLYIVCYDLISWPHYMSWCDLNYTISSTCRRAQQNVLACGCLTQIIFAIRTCRHAASQAWHLVGMKQNWLHRPKSSIRILVAPYAQTNIFATFRRVWRF